MDEIIARVLSGESSAEDMLLLSDWLSQNQQNRSEFKKLKSYWDAEVSYTHSISSELSLERLRLSIEKKEKNHRLKRLFALWTPLAACITALIVVTNLYLTKESPEQKEAFTYVTGSNKADVVLADGTRVVLNKNSKLTYTNDFGEILREVKLEGEAYFDVQKDSLRTFKVVVNGASVSVLGTKFNVKANTSDQSIKTTLLEGSVSFETNTKRVLLKPHQQLIYNKLTSSVNTRLVDGDEIVAWKDEVLKYKSKSLQYIMDDLSSIYNVKIVILNRKLSGVVISGSYEQDESIDQLLTIISKSLEMKWIKKDSVYYIK
ncbi:MAG: FecR family protein [Macellibacteroides fermentans]|uniref:FecR family protein n=1 Tax=Macellibacteroides fermentans TaxID=879969 RepID=UPI003ACB4F8E